MYLQLVRNLNLTALLICIHFCTLSYRLRHLGAGYLGDGFSVENGAFGEIGGKFRECF